MSGLLRSCSGSRPAAPRARPQASEAPTRPKEKRGGATSTRTCPWRGKLHCTTTTPQSFRQMLTVRWSWLSRRVTSSQFMETWMMTAFTWGSLEGNVDLCPGKMDHCHNHPHHGYIMSIFLSLFSPISFIHLSTQNFTQIFLPQQLLDRPSAWFWPKSDRIPSGSPATQNSWSAEGSSGGRKVVMIKKIRMA